MRRQQIVLLHNRFRILKQKVHEDNIRAHNSWNEVFVHTAKKMLPPDLFEKIQQAATDAWFEMDDDEPGTECAGPESETPPSRSPTA